MTTNELLFWAKGYQENVSQATFSQVISYGIGKDSER